MDWITTVNGLIALLSGLLGLIGTGVGLFFAIKNGIKAFKEKSNKEKWEFLMQIADAAMKSVEHSSITGPENKKKAVMEAIKDGCKAAGINADMFMDQLDAYIDSCIHWYNDMQNKKD